MPSLSDQTFYFYSLVFCKKVSLLDIYALLRRGTVLTLLLGHKSFDFLRAKLPLRSEHTSSDC